MAVKRLHISGIDMVLANLNAQIIGIQNKSRQGLWIAGLLIEGESKELTPWETGHLAGGTYTNPIGTADAPGMEIGYVADYAVYVHERTELHHEPPTQAKFLETALKKNEKRILQIIKDTARV